MAAWYDRKWNPFGNVDDEPSPNYLEGRPQWLRKLAWWCRNPLHNFCFHWIGVHDYVTHFTGYFLRYGQGVAMGWVHTKSFKFPLVSYRGRKVEWYAGWRRNGGFGLALRKAKSRLDSGRVPS